MTEPALQPSVAFSTMRVPVRPTIAETKRMAVLAKRRGGLNLNPEKVDFFHQRLNKRVVRTGLRSFRDYCDLLESARGQDERKIFVEALTTHTTSFFREQKHFDWLDEIGWSEFVADGAGLDRNLTIWSAACSSGAELYSTLISVKEHEARHNLHLRIEAHGTDLSTSILRQARQAVFSSGEIKGLNEARRRKFILRAKDGSDRYRIAPELRGLAKWNTINLTNAGKDGPISADLILLRNVLIYFDDTSQAQVVQELCSRLRSNGVLMTGHSESLPNLPSGMQQVASAIYRKQE